MDWSDYEEIVEWVCGQRAAQGKSAGVEEEAVAARLVPLLRRVVSDSGSLAAL